MLNKNIGKSEQGNFLVRTRRQEQNGINTYEVSKYYHMSKIFQIKINLSPMLL